MAEYRFLRPLDVLYLRGNRLFGGPGDHGEALMPPWPSLAAGALRSRMLADAGVPFAAYARGRHALPAPLDEVLGTPAAPGAFRVSAFTVARARGGVIEALFPAPADLVLVEGEEAPRYARPQALDPLIATSTPTPCVAIAPLAEAAKAQRGWWLTGEGLARYLEARPLEPAHWVRADRLWRPDARLGIALDRARRTAAEGQIYTTDTVALDPGTGFVVGVEGADGCLPGDGLLRFGGDGRAANVRACADPFPQPDWRRLDRTRRFRLVLATPALLPAGWRLPGLDDDDHWHGPGVSARLLAAAVPRAPVISGWDLARNRPKAAERAVPAGSVYWFNDLEGDVAGLVRLAREGLWPLLADGDRGRRAEGFNNVLVAASD